MDRDNRRTGSLKDARTGEELAITAKADDQVNLGLDLVPLQVLVTVLVLAVHIRCRRCFGSALGSTHHVAGFDHTGWEAANSTVALSVVLLLCSTNAFVSHEKFVLEGLILDINGQVVLLDTRITRN